MNKQQLEQAFNTFRNQMKAERGPNPDFSHFEAFKAGIAAAAPAPSAPVAWLATDLDGRGDVAFTKEAAQKRAGELCTHFEPLYSAAPAPSEQCSKCGASQQSAICKSLPICPKNLSCHM